MGFGRPGRRTLILALIAGAAPLFVADRAEAIGFGYGYGFMGFNPLDSSQVVGSINDRAAARGQAAFASRSSSLPAQFRGGGGSGSMFPVRDSSFFERYDIDTRLSMESRVARRPSAQTTLVAPRPAAPARPAWPPTTLAGFFNAANILVWPPESPVDGDLGTKRTVSDASTLSVLQETQARGYATTSTVAEARMNLLNYGRYALDFLRKSSTTQTADHFHRFLLSLYDIIGRSA
ncbi:MAG: hypothetical protein ABI353_14680 [Isosphaeraceae bacterium]